MTREITIDATKHLPGSAPLSLRNPEGKISVTLCRGLLRTKEKLKLKVMIQIIETKTAKIKAYEPSSYER